MVVEKFRLGIILFCIYWLTACALTDNNRSNDNLFDLGNAPLRVEHYLKAANTSDLEKRVSMLLLATHAAINVEDLPTAKGIILRIQKEHVINKELIAETKYQQARIAYLEKNNKTAINFLTYTNADKITNRQVISFAKLKSQIYGELGDKVRQAGQLSILSEVLPQDYQYQDQLWNSLMYVEIDDLNSLSKSNVDPVFTGWLTLASIVKSNSSTPELLSVRVGEWVRANPSHPAAKRLPSQLVNSANTKPIEAQKIAVMLPLTGDFAEHTGPIRDGILASYIAKNDSNKKIIFLDTNKDGVDKAYKDAVSAKADLIIGPLTIDEIKESLALRATSNNLLIPASNPISSVATSKEQGSNTLAPIVDLSINTKASTVSAMAALPVQICLNIYPNMQIDKDVYYLSMSPSQEAEATAKFFFDNKMNTIVFVKADTSGSKMGQAYAAFWNKLTGEDAEIYYFNEIQELQTLTPKALQTNKSKDKRKKLTIKSRSDLDAIYIIGSANEVTMVKSFIDANVDVKEDAISIYAPSKAKPSIATSELNKVIFADIPWLDSANEELSNLNEIKPNWSNNQKRLYVLGYDAFDLIGALAQMRSYQGLVYKARGGDMSVTMDGVVHRKLSWFLYKDGDFTMLNKALDGAESVNPSVLDSKVGLDSVPYSDTISIEQKKVF